MRGFSLDTSFHSHSLKTCTLGRLGIWVWGLCMPSLTHQEVSSSLFPIISAWRGSSTPKPWVKTTVYTQITTFKWHWKITMLHQAPFEQGNLTVNASKVAVCFGKCSWALTLNSRRRRAGVASEDVAALLWSVMSGTRHPVPPQLWNITDKKADYSASGGVWQQQGECELFKITMTQNMIQPLHLQWQVNYSMLGCELETLHG